MTDENAIRVAKTICNLCPTRCGLDIHLDKERMVKIKGMPEHPFGPPCIKSQAIIDWVYHKDRITAPMKKVKGKFKPISWDEALGYIADKLKDIKDKDGARSMVAHLGFPFIGTAVQRLCRRFCQVYETPNFTTGASVCFSARMLAQSITFNHNTTVLSPSYQGSQCHIVWGMNPTESGVLQAGAVSHARKKGAKLMVVDPRAIPLAKQADIHAQIRPGTDAALALGMLNVIIGEGLYDQKFVEERTHGFRELTGHVKNYPPDRVAEITWVPGDIIKNMARLYATSKPACISQGVALDHSSNGIQNSRALACLIAICGNYDIPGGSTYSRTLNQQSLDVREDIIGEIGAEYPLFTRFLDQSSSAPVTNAILTGEPYPIKALIIHGSNTVLTWPQTAQVKKAYRKLDLLVVIDMFMNETAETADIFLPAASFVESTTLKDYAPVSLPMTVLTREVIKPLGNSWPDWKIWLELGKKMGYGDYFPWNTDDEIYSTLLEPSGITLDQLKERPGGFFHHGREKQRYLDEGFHTPSGKVELYSKIMEEHGYDPLPTYHEPLESPLSTPDLAKDYPLILISGPRIGVYTHSQLRNVEVMRKRHPEPLVQINPSMAEELGINEGDEIIIETNRGSSEMKAQLTPDILPGVVSVSHGWGYNANANLLTSNTEMDPISGYPAYKSMLCKLSKK